MIIQPKKERREENFVLDQS